MNSRLRIESLAGSATPMQTGRDVQIPFHINRHPVTTTAGIEIVEYAQARDRSVGSEVVSANRPRAFFRWVRFNQIEDPVVWRYDQAVRNFYLRRGEDPRDTSIQINSVNATLSGEFRGVVAEVDSSLTVERHIIGGNEILPFILIDKHFNPSCFQIRAREPGRRACGWVA